jgi:sodium-dependent dicarboxylate transporter 2/3/5
MVANMADQQERPRWPARVGVWLGPALFVAILSMPIGRSLLSAAAEVVRADMIAQVERSPSAHGGGRPSADEIRRRVDDALAADPAAFEQQRQRRARAILATAATGAWVAVWWMTLAAPIAATSLLPLVLLPALGVMPIDALAVSYADPTVFLFMGGFMIALGIERWGLHRRIALHVLRAVGGGPSRIVLGFMIAAAVLSMWISNTATALMMLPIGMAVVAALPELGDERHSAGIGPALMLGIAYGASIGGIATQIGTPPNIAFAGQFRTLFPEAPPIGFAQWMLMFVPVSAVLLLCTWWILTRVTCRVPRGSGGADRGVIAEQLRRLGRMSGSERWMLVVFVLTALLWITRRTIPLGGFELPGWSNLLAKAGGRPFLVKYLDDATVAVAMAVLLFVLPGGRDAEQRRVPLLDWNTARRLPWDILLLFGGGFAIASAFRESGLSRFVAGGLTVFSDAPPFALVAGTCLLVTFLTELTSNTATTQVMLPVLAGAATDALHINPLMLMIPATISASCAFMLPVATPPNAIVFGSGQVQMRDMLRSGLMLNLVGVIVISLAMYLLVLPALGVSGGPPGWSR